MYPIPGGHIEQHESPLEAAKRELYEETGAIEFTLHPICNYSVTIKDVTSYGQLYYAEITLLSELCDYEIAEILLADTLPLNLTYEKIQPILFHRIINELA